LNEGRKGALDDSDGLVASMDRSYCSRNQ